ncbi:MAG: NAD(+) synthase [Patescibacteria group bacterium]|jgi:NAD+ synthase (glutamine-hydrolysing)
MKADRFLDIRNHGFFRVAAVIPRVFLADPKVNGEEHLKVLRTLYDEGVMYAVFPELSLTGYSNGDLFQQKILLEEALTELKFLVSETASWSMIITVGMPLLIEDQLFNVAVTFCRGEVLGIAPKSYLPNYREFYEGRWFTKAADARKKEVELFGRMVPFGADVLIRSTLNRNFILHTEICEDIWVPISPGAIAAISGATVLVNLSASNITIGKTEYRRQLALNSSGKNVAAQIYVAAGFGESTSDLSWDGSAFVAERGTMLSESKRFQMESHYIIADVDVDSLQTERARQNSFQENAAVYRQPMRMAVAEDKSVPDFLNTYVFDELRRNIEPQPFVPSDPTRRSERCYETFNIQAGALAQRLLQFPVESRKIVLGVSGGLDSTHAFLIAAHTMDIMGLPRSNILAVTMPGFGTTGRTYHNAVALIKAIGATFYEIPIKNISTVMFENIGYDPSLEGDKKSLVFENVQAWERTMTLFSVSAKEGGIVLGTGDLSELLIGWATYGGDHMSHYGVNADVPKTLIRYLVSWARDEIFAKEARVQTVLNDILDTPVSPELLPTTRDGNIAQKTEDIVGPYELIDFFGYWIVRFGFTPYKVARLALHAFDGKYTIGEIKNWLGYFVDDDGKKHLGFLPRFFRNQFKRNCLPDGPKVGLTSVSPRGDWRMPSDARVTSWMDSWEEIPYLY